MQETPVPKSAYLTDSLARSFVLQAITEGLIKFASPENAYEAQQVREIRSELERNTAQQDALRFALMFERCHIDDGVLSGGELFRFRDIQWESDEVVMPESRPIVEWIAPELAEMIDITSHGLEGFKIAQETFDAYGQSSLNEKKSHILRKDIASSYSLVEPLIWNSFSRAGAPQRGLLTRRSLRRLLDFLVCQPETLWYLGHAKNDDRLFDDPAWWRPILEPLLKQNDPSDRAVLELRRLLYTCDLKGQVARSLVLKAVNENAVLPVSGLSTQQFRDSPRPTWLSLYPQEEIVTAVNVFLEEIEFVPRCDTFRDLFKLRNSPAFEDFRDVLTQWTSAVISANIVQERKLRGDIQLANRSLKIAGGCVRVGGWLTYLTVPLIVAETYLLPGLGTAVGIAGFGLQGTADWLNHKSRWLLFARGE